MFSDWRGGQVVNVLVQSLSIGVCVFVFLFAFIGVRTPTSEI